MLFLLLVAGAAQAQIDPLRDFETDYCTLFANGTPRQPDLWKHCCFEHDLRYWFGGSLADQDLSDFHLKQCVNDVAGSAWAWVIYNGVRSGHLSPVKHRFFWGWGWGENRANTPLTEAEKVLIRQRLSELDLAPEYLEEFLRKNNLQ